MADDQPRKLLTAEIVDWHRCAGEVVVADGRPGLPDLKSVEQDHFHCIQKERKDDRGRE